jgi:hypothetical protein
LELSKGLVNQEMQNARCAARFDRWDKRQDALSHKFMPTNDFMALSALLRNFGALSARDRRRRWESRDAGLARATAMRISSDGGRKPVAWAGALVATTGRKQPIVHRASSLDEGQKSENERNEACRIPRHKLLKSFGAGFQGQ